MELGRTRMSVLVGVGAMLLALPAMGGKPAVTELCMLSGDVQSLDDAGELVAVEIGVSTTAWELLDLDGFKTTLWLTANVLNGANLTGGDYYGQARLLKNNGPEGGRFDFDFDTVECTSPGWGDTPPYGDPYNNWCRYHLTILDGVYYRGGNEVTWDDAARVLLIDYGQGPPCAVFPDDPECVEPGEYLVGEGPLDSLTAQFGTSGGEEPPPETEPEKSDEACHDGVDNDGDGLVDEGDPNCKKWYR